MEKVASRSEQAAPKELQNPTQGRPHLQGEESQVEQGLQTTQKGEAGSMSNDKHYPLHPNQSHPPIMTCEIPLEEYESLKRENAELKAKLEIVQEKLESVQATAYAESVDAGMRERRLKRALWIARAERSNDIHFMWCQFIYDRKYGIVKFNVKKDWGENIKKGQILHTPQGWADVWEEVERKCRAKAEQYK